MTDTVLIRETEGSIIPRPTYYHPSAELKSSEFTTKALTFGLYLFLGLAVHWRDKFSLDDLDGIQHL
jgi:hypothetical protein